MPLLNKRTHTLEDIYALPEGQRAELIAGQIYDMSPPSRIHQKLVMELSVAIKNYIGSKNDSCDVYPAPFAVFILNDETNYVEPDISVICDSQKLSDRGCEGAPDWIIEIVSPSSRRMDYYKKNALYADAGVREYWIVDPSKERTMVCNFEKNESPMIISFDQAVHSDIYDDLSITINDLLE